VQNLDEKGLAAGLILLSSSFVPCNDTNLYFPVDIRFTLTAISPSPCHLQTNHQLKSISIHQDTKVWWLWWSRAQLLQLSSRLEHCVKQGKNKWLLMMVLRRCLKEPPVVATAVRDTFTVNLDKGLYVVFDLETTVREE
jgi:hypothetical protein